MKISTVLDHIDSGYMALPEFQRGYVWNRDQVRGLFDSLYRRHPVGGLLVWA
ncbi:MAG: GmrSD restriction endonuclease domain-containing protein, partial [Gammaproteobacteria bacterium]